MLNTEESPRDAVLIERFCGGDEAAFEDLYRRYRGKLYAFLNNLIGPGAECDEVFEETWLRVIDRLPKYRDDGRFGAWLFRVARNIFYDRMRRRRAEADQISLDVDEPIQVMSGASGPGEQLELSEIERLVVAEAAKLPLELRETFWLRQQGLAFKEIAAMQNCSINTALSRMQYALRALRKALAGFDRGVLSGRKDR